MKLVKVENGIKLVVSKGAKGDSIEWKGEWSPTVVYDTIHVVSRGGASWISKQSANIGHDPLTDDGTWWECMVADSLAEGYRDEALTYRNQAEDFAESAATSAANAATSETNAAISAQNAAESEANASASETKARQWAENPEDVEVEAGQYSAYHWAKKAEAAAPPAVEDQIVDGVIYKAPSQNAVYDALATKVAGPVSSIDGGIAVFDGTDGKALKVAGSKLSSCYERGSIPSIKGTLTAADRYTWVSPAGGLNVGINGNIYTLTGQVELNLNNSSSWDSISPDYTIAANRAGKDFYVYACQPQDGYAPVLILSANSTYPAGYTADTSRKIGGFHCLCASVGTISGHPLSGFVTGDILPLSVWDLLHRPKSASPEGMVWSEAANIWVDIYLQSGTGSTTASAYGATITDTRTWMDHVDDLGAVGKRLLNDAEFQIIAAGGNEKTNISGSSDPVTTGGHVDTAGRRMISSIGCEDCTGVMWQWLSDQSYRSDGTTWSWKDLPGGKGSIFTQGTFGDVKLRAGGAWHNGADCGSRCRDAGSCRWAAHADGGARGAAEPM